MKFKDKDGNVYEDIIEAFVRWFGCYSVAEAARLMDYEVVVEASMDKQKPRICEVLGVEVGERFTAKTPYGDFTRCEVTEEGMVLTAGANVLCYIINHPESIIRKPRFTEEEVADARAIMRLFHPANGGTKIRAYEDGKVWIGEYGKWECRIADGRFPSIRPGQSVRLSEIVGGAE